MKKTPQTFLLVSAVALAASCLDFPPLVDSRAALLRLDSKVLILTDFDLRDNICSTPNLRLNVLSTSETPLEEALIGGFYPTGPNFSFREEFTLGLFVDDYFSTIPGFENSSEPEFFPNDDFESAAEVVERAEECGVTLDMIAPLGTRQKILAMDENTVCLVDVFTRATNITSSMRAPTTSIPLDQTNNTVPCMPLDEWNEERSRDGL